MFETVRLALVWPKSARISFYGPPVGNRLFEAKWASNSSKIASWRFWAALGPVLVYFFLLPGPFGCRLAKVPPDAKKGLRGRFWEPFVGLPKIMMFGLYFVDSRASFLVTLF